MSDTAPLSNVKELSDAIGRTHAELAASGQPGVCVAAPSGLEPAAPAPAETPSELDSLPQKQRIALEELLAGASYTDAAYNAGVDRRTLYNWINHNPTFRAALESWRERTLSAAEQQLIQGTALAVDTLRRAAIRDFRAAALLLKGRGLLSGTGPGRPRKMRPVELTNLPIPRARIGDFELRLRALILSFREEPTGEAGVPEGKEVTIETPGTSRTT